MHKRQNITEFLRIAGACVISLFTVVACTAVTVKQGPISDREIETLAEHAMAEFNVPGLAIGIVRGDKTLYARGFGVRQLGAPDPIDIDSLFKIASASKAFTAAALAILVDEGKISWDGRVTDHVPEFLLSDPWVTANFTVTDLLTHRSGFRNHVGDQLLWPEPNSFTREDIIRAFRYFDMVSGFRSEYAYDNLLYIVADEVIARVSGRTWGEFVDERIMRPAGMKRCFAGEIPQKEMHNLAIPHGVVEGQLSIIERGRISGQPPVNAAAGGIVCSLGDMLTWAKTQLLRGTTPGGVRLFSAAQSREMWLPRTRLGVSERDFRYNRTHFFFYGLGWRLSDVNGYLQVSHTGSVAGFRSYVVLIPEMELGVVVLSNGSSVQARDAVMNSIIRSFMQLEPLDWIQIFKNENETSEMVERSQEEEPATGVNQSEPILSKAGNEPGLTQLVGRYRDPWFGDVVIRMEDGQLVYASEKSPKFIGSMQHHDGDRFVVRWSDRSMNGDAWVLFERGEDGSVVSMSMLALYDGGDWDYKDLHFTRVEQ